MTEPIQITLDWDNIAYHEAIRRIEKIKKNIQIKKITLFESSTQKGYHCVCDTFYYLNPVFVYRIRRAWQDDGVRLVGDILYKSAPFRDVAFSYKMVKGHKLTRTKMLIIQRDKSLSWQQTFPQVENLTKNGQLQSQVQ